MQGRLCLVIMLAGCVLPAAPTRGQIRTGDSGTGATMGPVKEDPKKTAEAIRRRCNLHMDKAAGLLAQGEYTKAWKALRRAESLLINKQLAQRWAKMATRLNTIAQAAAQLAEQLYQQGQYQAAVKAYRKLTAGYAGLPAAKAARQRLKAIESDPAVRGALKEQQAKKMFQMVQEMLQRQRRRLAKEDTTPPAPAATAPAKEKPAQQLSDVAVLKSLDDEGFLQAVGHLARLVKACEPAPTALKAAEWLKQLAADPQAQARLARLRQAREAQQELARANAYHKAGMIAKAAELYREIIAKYPGSAVASQAAKHLGALTAAADNTP